MSNKPFSKLNDLDLKLRKAWPIGMRDETLVTIEFISGFELFNTRPYHNYETWSNGYRITDVNGIKIQAEDLDDAVNLYIQKRNKFLEDKKNENKSGFCYK